MPTLELDVLRRVSRPPRLHDLRHTAAVHRVLTGYQQGHDVQQLLPKLVGHRPRPRQRCFYAAVFADDAGVAASGQHALRRLCRDRGRRGGRPCVTPPFLGLGYDASCRKAISLAEQLAQHAGQLPRQPDAAAAVCWSSRKIGRRPTPGQYLRLTVYGRFWSTFKHDRQCAVLTRNHRLAAIHSLARYIGSPLARARGVVCASSIGTVQEGVQDGRWLLGQARGHALLRVPDQQTVLGARDYALMLFLYNSGARADEAASLRACNLQLGTSPSVRILGKGNKWRVCPLWPKTQSCFGRWSGLGPRGPRLPRSNR